LKEFVTGDPVAGFLRQECGRTNQGRVFEKIRVTIVSLGFEQ
jgi:hypothetical protein